MLLSLQLMNNLPLKLTSYKNFIVQARNKWLGRCLGIITGWDPSVCNSHRLHVHILWCFLIKLEYIPYIPLKRSVLFLQSWTSTGYFWNSTPSSVTNCRFSPIIGSDLLGSWMHMMNMKRFGSTLLGKVCRPLVLHSTIFMQLSSLVTT